MSNDAERGDLIPMGSIPRLEQFPDLKHLPKTFDPDHLTAVEVLKIITLALAQTKGADVFMRLRAQAVMEEQFARGCKAGRDEGRREGYGAGYAEGLEEGKREALDKKSAEEAESAMLRAAARARREA